MKHGPLALVDENLPIVVIATHGQCFRLVFICYHDNLVEVLGGIFNLFTDKWVGMGYVIMLYPQRVKRVMLIDLNKKGNGSIIDLNA